MTDRGEIWRRRLWVWLPALLFFLANAAAFSVYRLGYAGQVQRLEADLEEQNAELKKLQTQRQELEMLINRVRTNREQVRQLYAERLAPRRQRLTAITAELRELASKAGLQPQNFSYPEAEIEDFGLVERSFIFSVGGTYAELRKFVNLLELSPSFLTLKSATLTSGGDEGPDLRINLTISTLFARETGVGQELPGPPPSPEAAEEGEE